MPWTTAWPRWPVRQPPRRGAASNQPLFQATNRRRTRFKTTNDLPEATRIKAIEELNARLADGIDLQTQTKQAHWNARGPTFIALHVLFDKVNGGEKASRPLFSLVSRSGRTPRSTQNPAGCSRGPGPNSPRH